MKRLLMTGASVLQVGINARTRLKKIDVPRSIVAAAQKAGWEVDWRVVGPEDDTSGYDLVWVNVAPVLSMQAPYALGALWAAAAAWRQDQPLVLFYDDWKVRDTRSHARTFVRMVDRQLNKRIGHRDLYRDQAAWLGRKDGLVEAAGRIGEANYGRASLVIPTYTWGNRDAIWGRFLEATEPRNAEAQRFFLDPSGTIELIDDVPGDDQKVEGLAIAALGDHTKWIEKQRFTWPVDFYGSKHEPLKTELDVQAAYARHWGILSPPYYSAGSGWWRSRFLYGAHVGSVVICDPREPMGLPGYHVTGAELEAADLEKRRDLVARQRAALLPTLWSADTFNQAVEHLLARTVNRE